MNNKLISKIIVAMLVAVLVSGVSLYYRHEEAPVLAADTIDTVANPAGVKIDLFDYSLFYEDADGLHETEELNFDAARARGDYTYAYNATSGINFVQNGDRQEGYCHLFRFFSRANTDGQNSYVGNGWRGYVLNRLGNDGYPVASNNASNYKNVYGDTNPTYNLIINGSKNKFDYDADGDGVKEEYRYIIDTNSTYVHGVPGPGVVLINPKTWVEQTHEAQALYYTVEGDYQLIPIQMEAPELFDSVKNESLAYLFDPSYEHVGKDSYEDVNELFVVDEDGFYSFDSDVERAVYDNGRFNVYSYENNNNNYHGFFPFDQTEHNNINKYDHYLGMHMQIEDFSIPTDGQVVNSAGEYNDMEFSFRGDDDVWIYVDGVLVSDLGGVHNAVSTTINFATGEITCDSGGSINGTSIRGNYTLRDVFAAVQKTDFDESQWDGNTFRSGTYHTLDFFYLERGNNRSNLFIKYNLINTYDFSGHKVLHGGTLDENDYHFTLRGYEDDQGQAAIMPAGGSELDPDVYWSGITTGSDALGAYKELTVGNAMDGNVNFGDFSRTEAEALIGKTFRYSVSEVIPDGATLNSDGTYSYTDTATGITTVYDSRVYYFTGELYRSGTDIWLRKTYYTDETFTTPDPGVTFINFNNQYNAAMATISITKDLVGRDWQTGESYEFALYDDEDNVIDTVTLSADGTASFGDLMFTSIGDYTYRISETTDPLPPGIDKSADVIATVSVTQNANEGLVANVTYTNDGIIKNTYTAEGSADLSVTKVLNGRPWQDTDSFSFDLIDDATGNTLDTKTADKDHQTVGFASIEYDQDDIGKTYTYTITETDTLPSYMRSSGDITATVKVTDNGDGTLATQVTYTNSGTITNTYTPAPVTSAINVSKTVSGYVPGADSDFTMELYHDNSLIDSQTVTTTGGSGTVSFDGITYDSVGVYNYTVKEKDTGVAGFTYDVNEYAVTVTVTDNYQGSLVASVSYGASASATSVQVTNSFAQAGVDVTLNVIKNITDVSGSASDGDYTFELRDSSDAVIQQITVTTSGLTGSSSFAPLSFDTSGTYNYTVVEQRGSEAGITYDPARYDIVIQVSDNVALARLDADVEINGAEGTDITFTNVYEPAAALATISLTKVINDTSGSAPVAEFEFTLKDGSGNTVDTRQIRGAGNVTFDQLSFTRVGTYDYTVSETQGSDAGYIYDTSEYPVTITVNDLGGNLDATVDYGAVPEITITNTYDPADCSVTIRARKVINDLTDSIPQATLNFELVDPNTGSVISRASREGAGLVYFDDLTYSQVGSHEYIIREVQGRSAGFTYDNKEYTVTVDVTDNGAGALVANATYQGGEAVFTNTYKAAPADLTLDVSKTVSGSNAPAEVFRFNLTDSDQNVIQTKTVTGQGTVSFDPIEFTKTGTYTYYCTEVSGSAEGFEYDATKYIVIVTVRDIDASLVASYSLIKLSADGDTRDAQEIVFTNTYKAADEPAVTPTIPATPTIAPEAPAAENSAPATGDPTSTDLVVRTGEDSISYRLKLYSGLVLICIAVPVLTITIVKKRRQNEQE